jgi:lipopolysaccharide assembly outer membrane protein LptD (OstA)
MGADIVVGEGQSLGDGVGAGGGDLVSVPFGRARVACVGALLAAAAAMGSAGSGAAAPAEAPLSLAFPLHLTADQVAVDNTGATLVASGHVQVDYGADHATANALRLTRATRTAELSGHVTVTGPQGQATAETVTLTLTPANEVSRAVMTGTASVETPQYALSADTIDADRSTQRLVADGHVTAFDAPDLIINGDRIVYDQRTEHGVVTGHPTVANKAGRLQGSAIDLYRAQSRAIVHGPVQADVYGATITSAAAAVDFKTSVATLTGHVVIVRRQGTLWADRVTIYYEARRMVAQGTTRAHFTELGDTANP